MRSFTFYVSGWTVLIFSWLNGGVTSLFCRDVTAQVTRFGQRRPVLMLSCSQDGTSFYTVFPSRPPVVYGRRCTARLIVFRASESAYECLIVDGEVLVNGVYGVDAF